MGSHEAYLRSALSKYRHPDQTKQEVLGIFQSFSDLRPNVMNYVFNDGQKEELLCLEGTIPVTYKDKTYNIPISIYLMDTHPNNPPIIYVKPTPTMQIKQGRHVDAAGRVYLPYLHEWNHPSSDLLGLIQILAIVFGEEPPVFSKQQTAPACQKITGGLVEDETTMGSREAYLQSALSKYRHPDETKREVLGIFQSFSDLRPNVMNYVFNDGQKEELLCLEGTIPVTYKVKTYNIPICIYLMDTHPNNPPIVFVKPTQTMQIKQGRHVDAAGRVYLPYLHEWMHPSSDLLGLIQILAIVFGEEPPVFSKQQTTPATTSQPP